MAAQNYPESNLQTETILDNFIEKSVDYTNRFGDELTGFLEALDITRPFPVQEGFKIEMFTAPEVTLADGNVAEGDIIPLSKVEPKPHSEKEIKLKKYRKATSAESIQRYGLEQAINLTDEALIKEIQKGIRDDLFTMIQAGQATDNIGEDFQSALASAWSAIQVAFEDDTVGTVVFAHPQDVAKLIADKQLTLETKFGLNYYEDATGTTVFTSTQVEKGSIYATAPENLQVAYVSANGDLGRSFGLTSDDTGYLGMKHFTHNESATQQTLIMSGVLMFPERVDGVVKVEIEPDPLP
ncbi:MAG: phage capsid protein [Alkalibacterium sp.]|nr:phage capsid protein [Alkalibacterium sp.]